MFDQSPRSTSPARGCWAGDRDPLLAIKHRTNRSARAAATKSPSERSRSGGSRDCSVPRPDERAAGRSWSSWLASVSAVVGRPVSHCVANMTRPLWKSSTLSQQRALYSNNNPCAPPTPAIRNCALSSIAVASSVRSFSLLIASPTRRTGRSSGIHRTTGFFLWHQLAAHSEPAIRSFWLAVVQTAGSDPITEVSP